MTLRGWLALFVIYVAYLFLGAFLFHALECPQELAELEDQEQEDDHLTGKIRAMWDELEEQRQKELEHILGHWRHRGFAMRDSMKEDKVAVQPKVCMRWNQHNSLFFSFTVVTTIGYGHQAPTTTSGRMFCILYALIGIPLNAILVTSLGKHFKEKMCAFKTQLREGLGKAGPLGRHVSQAVVALEDQPKAVVVAAESFFFFLLFFLAFLPIPAIIFTALENQNGTMWENGDWTFPDSLYYTFITLSTIGFGDMVPGRNMDERSPAVRRVYLAGIIMWIILGMAYIWGVLEIISGTLKTGSKPVKKALQGLKNQLAIDTDHWKKIIGELIVVKHGRQPVPGDELLCGGSGGSQPCLAAPSSSSSLEGPRRALSLGDLALEDSEEQRDSEGITRTASLSQPRCQDESCQAGEVSSLVSLEHDTITSLRQFLKTAQRGRERTWAENNIMPGAPGDLFPERSEAGTREASRQSSFNLGRFQQETAYGLRVPTYAGSQRTQQRSSLSRNPSNASTVASNFSSRHSRYCNSGVGRLLEETSLREFLQAVESVRVKESRESVLATPDVQEPVVDLKPQRGVTMPSFGAGVSRIASEARRKLSLKRLSSRGSSSPNQSGIESLVLNEVGDVDTPSRDSDTQGQGPPLGLVEENNSSVQGISFPDDIPRM